MTVVHGLDAGTWHVDIIAAAVAAIGGVYVEIGVQRCQCFYTAAAHADEAHAVDTEPAPHGFDHDAATYWHMRSDEFFARFDKQADVVFIDGDHSAVQAGRDFTNALRVLSGDGTIFLHDTWPVSRDTEEDTGTVWRVAADVERGRLNVFTFRRYPGLTMVQWPRLGRFA